jgi:hypothetical protein
MAERLRSLEARLEVLEAWRLRSERVDAPTAPVETEAPPVAIPDTGPSIPFDLALIGRTLIVLGGAYLLRAATESKVLSPAAGVLVGLLYSLIWSLLAYRAGVSRASAAHHGVATALVGLPLIVEAAMRFKVLHGWTAALALSTVSAIVLILASRRRLHGVAWVFTLLALAVTPVLIDVTDVIVPFALYLTALGLATVWLGYVLEWRLLRWLVASAANLTLLFLSFLVATNRAPEVTPATAIALSCLAVAAYLATFAVRTLLRHRDVIVFEIAQTIALFVLVLGGALWVASSRSTLMVPLAVVLVVLGAASYAVSFAFIPRRFATPANFVFYSSIALMLIVAGGSFLASGLASSILWTALATTSAYLSIRYRKSSLSLHAAVYLAAGFAGANLLRLGVRAFFMNNDGGWLVPSTGAALLFVACAIAASIPPIERKGTFELWTAAKVTILAELGWAGGALLLTAIGTRWLDSDAAVLAVVRTAVLGALTIGTAWASRYRTLSPARHLTTPLLVALALKLLWEDVRAGRPSTLFISFAIVGVVLIVAPRFRRRAIVPQPAELAAA